MARVFEAPELPRLGPYAVESHQRRVAKIIDCNHQVLVETKDAKLRCANCSREWTVNPHRTI